MRLDSIRKKASGLRTLVRDENLMDEISDIVYEHDEDVNEEDELDLNAEITDIEELDFSKDN